MLDCQNGKTIVDATLGGGGHALEILKAIGGEGRLIGIDRDKQTLDHTKERLSEYEKQISLVHAGFEQLDGVLTDLGVDKVDGILYDLGFSSLQVEDPARGLSYRFDGPLDMRLDASQPLTAGQVVNRFSKDDLTKIFKKYGEERWSSRIAEFILAARQRKPLETTTELVEVIKNAIPAAARRKGGHPAKRVFQALRIFVNKELENLASTLSQAVEHLNGGGRVVVISYHSLEDRIVKRFLRENSQLKRLVIKTSKPILPSKREVKENRRARSAKLRAAEMVS